ncbi:MAG: twin-arginine translocase subunit TatC [Granulosicoccus sp.]
MSSSDASVDKEEGFISHLVELRDRLIKMLLAVGILFLSLFWFSDKIYTALAAPLLRHLPDSQMIAIDVAAPFFIPFKLTLMLCVFLAVPYLLYQIWSFVAPGLYSHEKKLVVPLLVSSTLLFYLGVAFAYFVVFPLVFGFFTSVAPEGVTVSTDIGRYLDFVITLFFAFGIAFEVPVATVLVVAVGITTPEQLVKIRPYVFVAAFIIGMFLTPPDMISQTLLAIPMWLLYEVGIIFSRKYKDRIAAAGLARDKRYDEDDGEPDPNEPGPDGSDSGGAAVKGAPRSEKHEPEYTAPKPATASKGDVNKTDADSEAASSAKLGVVNPSLIKKPDSSGAYRNSLTDSDNEDPSPKPDSKTDDI